MSSIITFYSYKGGVGRTMCLANVSIVLARWGFKVLIVDWDLEAPGLEHFFQDYVDVDATRHKEGVVEILSGRSNEWPTFITPISIADTPVTIDLITSGKRDETYSQRVRGFDINNFYWEGGGHVVESLRNEWKSKYDFVLIDSRTGITDTGGICTIQLPDIVVLLFTATQQGFNGTLDVALRAPVAQQRLPFDRQRLVFLPVPTKFDIQAEYKLTDEWFDKFALGLEDVYKYWLPKSISRKEFLISTKVPYITYFSFGEKLPVIEQGTADPAGLGYAYENIAALLAHRMESTNIFHESRDKFVSLAINSMKDTGTVPSPKVFISHASEDGALRDVLKAYIKSKNDNLSFWDEDLTAPGINWASALQDITLQTKIFIFLLSDAYYSSATCLNEQFFLQKLIDERPNTTQVKLKKLLHEEYVDLPYKDHLDVLQTPAETNPAYLIISDDLKAAITKLH